MNAHDLLWGMIPAHLPVDAPGWAVEALSAGHPVVVRRRVEFLARRLWADRYPDVSPARQAVLGQLNAEGLSNILDAGGAGIGL